MKTKHQASSFLIKSNLGQAKVWDGQSLLTLGHPVRYVLQRHNEHVFVRDFTTKNSEKFKLNKFQLDSNHFGKSISLSDSTQDHVTITPLIAFAPVNMERARTLPAAEITSKFAVHAEDIFFKKSLRNLLAGTAVAIILMMVIKPSDPPTANEELIPKKYAKLILTKPKEKTAPSAAAAAQSQAQVKAVARAMQSKTVQKSISSILKGGLTKYSIMSTGRSIQSLSQKIQGNTNMTGTNLQNKASDLLAANHVGSNQIGSDNGYAAGHGTSVKGQGAGQLEIGLSGQDASVDEGLTKDEVARVIHAHMSEIRFCYESAILKDPTLAGKVMVDFKINGTGNVSTASISEATLADRQVGSCLVDKLKRWKFPNPRGGVIVAVSYPFIFKSLSR